ncbi:alpha-amylase family glycosyl hydrolase [uncultured Clostridium sp.]|uniref:alpha-amylase family glycosyl hydrolase n=1 Tax=uncultured Clostridium sp. TaxID=59620 RepID=UPI0025D45FC3|nr:alpha-amylase family glycosyl hydrolase [uncultured Clostridium sp.]
MKKNGVLKYKWQVSIMTLVFFCLSLVPFPSNAVSAFAETVLKSPVINSDGTVTFNYQGNGTEDAVKVKGEFSGWNTIDMAKGENNIWTTTVEGISGINEYGIVTWSPDTTEQELGDWKGDPLNTYKKGNNPAVVVNPQISNEKVTLYYLGNGTETRVAVKGSFDKDWGVLHEMTNESSSNIWSVTMDIAPGNYQYGIVTWSPDTVDQEWGDWKGDPLNPEHEKEGNFTSNAILVVEGESALKSPQINDDGTVTFRAEYEGEALYLIGSMVEWNTSKEIKMEKNSDGIFSTTIKLEPGTYEYKFKPNPGYNWEGAFIDQLNSEVANGNSVVIVPKGEEKKVIKVRFIKDDETKYENWGFWTWYPGEGGRFVEFDYVDKEGAYSLLELPVGVNSGEFGIIVKQGQDWSNKATGDLKYEISELNNDNNEIVVTYGEKEKPKSVEQRAFIKNYENLTVNIHYKRNKKDYDNWNLWTWLEAVEGAEGEKVEFTSEDSYGKVATKVYENLVNDNKVGFIVKRTEGDNEWAEKDVDSNRFIDLRHVANDGTLDIYVGQGKETFSYHSPVASKEITDLDGQVNGDMLYHNTWESLYKYPFGAVEEGTDVTVRMHAQKGDLQYARVLVRNTNTNRSDLYNMEKVSTITVDEEEVDIWEATFTPDEIGVYGYKFIVGDGDTAKYYVEDGYEGKTGTVGDKNGLFFQLTVYDKDYQTPDWMKEAVVYQIFPDRFNNGNTSNDDAKTNARGEEPIEVPESWNSLPDNPRLGEKNMSDIDGGYSGDGIWSNDFFGGDIKGIQEKLDYLQGLGVNTLYLNPISMAASNHKYDATDYKSLDPMFGTEEEFKSFTKELKSRGMHLIVDGVFNHVGDDSIYFDRYGKYDTVGAYEYWEYVYDKMNNEGLTEETAMTKADDYFVKSGQVFSEEKWHLWFNIKNSKVDVGTTNERYDYQGWWGYDSLPEFKSLTKDEAIELGLASASDEFVNKSSEWNNKELVDYIYKDEDSVAKQWIDWGADGWRLDVANEVDTVFWNDFREVMKEHNEDTLILGEIWDDASKYFVGDQYDSVMNYRIRAALIDYLKNGNATRLNDTLMAVYEDYPEEAFYALMNLMGSHDVARAIYVLGGGVDSEERAEFSDYDKALGKQRLKLAALFEFGYAGAPTIYYGDEASVTGSKDPDCRRTYPWGNEDESLVSFYEAIGSVRENNKELFSYGDLTTLYTGAEGVYVYGRSYEDEHAIVAINPTNTDAKVTIDLKEFTGNGTKFIDGLDSSYKVTVKDGKAEITIPSMTGRMMTSTNVIKLPDSVNKVTGTEGNGEVTLKWDAVKDAKEYKIYYSSFKGSLKTEVKTVENTEATIDGLVNGNRLYFAVSVIDKEGNESVLTWSDELTPHSKITWFGNLSDVKVDKVDISTPINVNAEVFIENISNEEGVSAGLVGRLLVKYPGDKEFTVVKANYSGEAGNNDMFTASFIANKSGKYEYKYEFTTKGTYGFNDENSVSYTEVKVFELSSVEDGIPAEAIELKTPEEQSGEVNLNWSVVGTNNITLYEIVRNGVVVARIQDGSIVSYKDTDVRNKTEYKYEVIAYTNGGNSVKSNEVTVTPDLVMVEVTFKLHAPSYTPLDATITMPGVMNGWDVNSWEMSRNGAVTADWTYTISVLEGETIEYKYVKGGEWNQEALMNYSNPKAANQSKYGCTTGEGGNEKITVVNQGDGKMLVENEVVRWKDMPVVVLDPSNGSYTKNESITVRGNSMLDPNLTINGEAVAVDENGNFAHEVKLNVGKNNIAIHIEPTEENKNNPDIFNNNAEAIGFATKDLELEITRLGEGEEIQAPVINVEDKVIKLGDTFNPFHGVTAIDSLGNDITERLEIVENTVDTSKEGEYKVRYKVVDDNGRETSKEIRVTVINDEEVEVPGDGDDSDKPGVDIKPDGGNQNGNNSNNNNKPGNIPQTGGTNTIYYVIIALVLVAGGVYFIVKGKKKVN